MAMALLLEDRDGRRPIMTTRNAALVLFTVIFMAGCAGRPTGGSVTDAPAAGIASVPSGTWRGVVTGREFATAAGVMPQKVTLEIGDGRWAAETPAGKAAGTVVTTRGRDVRLEGQFVEDSARSGARARYVMREVRPGFLGGSARSYFAGHGVHGWLLLDRVE
jgi:hypothetical protein